MSDETTTSLLDTSHTRDRADIIDALNWRATWCEGLFSLLGDNRDLDGDDFGSMTLLGEELARQARTLTARLHSLDSEEKVQPLRKEAGHGQG